MNRLKNPIVSGSALVVLLVLVIGIILSTGKTPKPVPTPTLSTAPTEPAPTEPSLNTPARGEKTVGICLPAEDEAWVTTGEQLQTQLTEAGYKVITTYGDGTAQKQNQLLLELMEQKADCLVVAIADSAAVTEAAQLALEKNIPILSYGALLMDTEATAGYICYDYQGMGVEIGKYVEKKYALAEAQAANLQYTVELFMGAPEDYNAILLHKGLLSVLKPYLDQGVLVCKSLRTDFEDCCILDWSAGEAERACANRLNNSYPDAAPDICICASDSIAGGVIRALEAKGMTSFVTGNGATEEGLINLTSGKQGLTVSTDPVSPAKVCAAMVDLVLFGIAPEVAMTEIFNNVTRVPTALCDFTLTDKNTGQ